MDLVSFLLPEVKGNEHMGSLLNTIEEVGGCDHHPESDGLR